MYSGSLFFFAFISLVMGGAVPRSPTSCISSSECHNGCYINNQCVIAPTPNCEEQGCKVYVKDNEVRCSC
jgi:hypothetical protein